MNRIAVHFKKEFMNRSFFRHLIIRIFMAVMLCGTASSQGAFVRTANDMSAGHFEHTATLLGNGKVLIAGGLFSPVPELFDPVTSTFSTTGTMNVPRLQHTATLLRDGRVLIVGGFGDTTAELFDPATGTFSFTGNMNTLHTSFSTATLLNNGQVLIVGGIQRFSLATAAAELYDPVTGTFALTGSMTTPRGRHTATLLTSGKVLIAGGSHDGIVFSSAELYDPTTGTFSPLPDMQVPRSLFTATRLSNGMVLIAGGLTTSETSAAAAELYDPVTETFSATGTLSTGRFVHVAALLGDGTVLIAGGLGNGDTVLNSAEIYDPADRAFTGGASMNDARVLPTATVLNNGQVLVAGGENNTPTGFQSLATAELYRLGLSFPIKGRFRDTDERLTPFNAVINSVFDHSMKNKLGEYHIYGCDDVVTDFIDEVADSKQGIRLSSTSRCPEAHFQSSGHAFVVNGHYSQGNALFYDGHPGYDYDSEFGNQVYATGPGTVHYPSMQDLQDSGVVIGGDPDNFQALELDLSETMKVFYLHLSSYPRAISVHLVTPITDQDFTAQADTRFNANLPADQFVPPPGNFSISGTVTNDGQPFKGVAVQLLGKTIAKDCVTLIDRTNKAGHYSFDHLPEGYYNVRAISTGFRFEPVQQNPVLLTEGSRVSAGDLIGELGNAGGCFGPHLHFEVQRATTGTVTDHLSSGQNLQLRFVPVDPYGWQPIIPGIADPYFQIQGLQNSGLTNEMLWDSTPSIAPL